MDNSAKYSDLRSRYPEFVYEAYHWQVEEAGLRLWFDFRMGDVVFHPTALVERREWLELDAGKLLDWVVFNIGMVELVSYWKCACAPKVRVECGRLDDQQVAFWRKLYWHGLGEFFYTNGITTNPKPHPLTPSPKGEGEAYGGEGSDVFMTIQCEGQSLATVPLSEQERCPWHLGHGGCGGEEAEAYLVPVGGGKDSVVTLELLRRAGKRIRPLIMNPRGATVECARVAGFPMDEVLVIRRTIDPTLLELNKQGYLNGHTPFSAMLAFYTMLASLLSGIPNVALSNESSANESTVLGTSVNHQYSKSLEFEDDFREYIVNSTRGQMLPTTHYPLSTYNYFSFLRPLSELQIAMLFSRFEAYHAVFRSCNVGSKQDIWCGHCAKCLFAYIILSPFIAPDRLNAIFGKSMLDDESLRLEFDQLLGRAETKPFECVGTVSEVNTALSMTLERWYPGERPALLRDFESTKEGRGLDVLLPIGNLTEEERKILSECIERNS